MEGWYILLNSLTLAHKKNDDIKFPSDWKMHHLGELGDFFKGKGISKKDRKDSGIPCVLYGEIYTKHHIYIKQFFSFIDEKTAAQSVRLQNGDILFTGSGETKEEIGKPVAYLNDIEAYAGGDIIILRPKNVNSLFLSYLLNSNFQIKERAKLAQGHSVVHIYADDLKSIKVYLPSLSEQQKIASVLYAWEKAVEFIEKLIEQKKEQKKGLMQKLFSGQVRFPGFYGEWKSVPIEKICTLSIGKTPSRNKKEYWGKGYKWIAIADMKEKYIKQTEEQITERAVKETKINLIPKNTVI